MLAINATAINVRQNVAIHKMAIMWRDGDGGRLAGSGGRGESAFMRNVMSACRYPDTERDTKGLSLHGLVVFRLLLQSWSFT